jgi:hypothetical protein
MHHALSWTWEQVFVAGFIWTAFWVLIAVIGGYLIGRGSRKKIILDMRFGTR